MARGGYLVRNMGCGDCHVPLTNGPQGPEPDLARGLSGRPQGVALPPSPAAKGPWIWGSAATNTAFFGSRGISFAATLTSGTATGIGSWTAPRFVGAIETGRHAGSGRHIAPPMPRQAPSTLTDDDPRARFTYLRPQPAGCPDQRFAAPTAPLPADPDGPSYTTSRDASLAWRHARRAARSIPPEAVLRYRHARVKTSSSARTIGSAESASDPTRSPSWSTGTDTRSRG